MSIKFRVMVLCLSGLIWGSSAGADETASDMDHDGLADSVETGTGIYVSAADTGTSPYDSDSDGDGLTDRDEVYTYLSDPNIADTDSDQFNDGFEVNTGFDPTSNSSTPDLFSEIGRSVEFSFAASNGVNYHIESTTNLSAAWETLESNIVGDGSPVNRLYRMDECSSRFFKAESDEGQLNTTSAIMAAYEFTFEASVDVSYRIEATDVLSNSWETIESEIIGAGETVSRCYSTVNQTNKYFRARINSSTGPTLPPALPPTPPE